MKKNSILIWITLFAISMGIFEGAVVIYIRALYYPEGFNFPLVFMENRIAITELIREFASLIMLLSVGVIAGKNFSQRFAWFIYSFAVWDIVYYIFLYLILGWPESLFTWDILFLLPVTWTGPVIAPVIISILMIILSLVIYKHNLNTNFKVKLLKNEWLLLILGSVVVFVSFIWDYCKFLIQNLNSISVKDEPFLQKVYDLSFKYFPSRFPWIVFVFGVVIISTAIFLIHYRNKKSAT